MTREELNALIADGPVILDGATGTNLMEKGMPMGVCPEAWILDNKEIMIDLQKRYVEAGTQILYAPTFTANRIKLEEYDLSDRLEQMNRDLVKISKEAAGGKAYVAGDMTMTGKQLFPLGDLMFEELVDVYKEQARILDDEGVDLFVVETMMSLQESRAAVIAIREVSDLPIMVSLTYNEDGRTLFGTTPEVAVVVLQSLGADVIGVNCSTGPAEMAPLVAKMAEYATIPILAKPNNGFPELIDGKTIYRTTPEEFAQAGVSLVEAGAAIVGGCCGTTPAHIRALAKQVKGMEVHTPLAHHRSILTSERKSVEVSLDGNFMVVGERINPTGKKKLQAELREGKLDLVREMARQQEENGARILDINMGMNGIDEKEMMQKVIYEVSSTVDCPLCIDSSYVEVIEAALRIYPGRALINSISMESAKLEALLPVAKKYGAMFILLPVSDEGLPKDGEEKKAIINAVYDRALQEGLAHEDIVVDGLVATIGANPEAARECFDTIAYCKDEKKLPTICGLSNISFGLPERIYVNTAFLTMAICKGLTMAIANPSQEILMNGAFSSDLLLHRPDSDIRYIERMNRLAEEKARFETVVVKKENADVSGSSDSGSKGSAVFQAVLKGNKGTILDEVKKELSSGKKPEDIINDDLIPAINEVGVLFDKKKYFLPQLIGSANTMKLAIDYLEPMLERKDSGADMPTLVIATVEGDIHDIGKNLVVLMLKNYGYNVIDMGKDVPAEDIIETAIKEHAAIIGLSALMTTTMMRMKDVVEMCKEKHCESKVIIGGACITQNFADEIGADGYSKDAAECVRLVERLLEESDS
ncbi:5-methyltetrahydrofolate--homocysteine methyltransferase [Roseburia sp. MUC/MUC-530-WT-4D]|uniref:Methionine synthase n=1 Tax=Roseburia porci TaxID=2605790 RepID=A0A6L5YQK8_9FIRM|nr:homocysteine S-methyltransferase family protein [Roseburia porci]MCI5516632.1 homocysteine S-methyltransferase family protein [Roseburia sp.]MDD6742333.1 homocysteine S-methyltransferase family protein [Roseburia porci]MST74392.1 5-methyltetrahydrofolate--homocysteine methyltransferase [Roseburia porci]